MTKTLEFDPDQPMPTRLVAHKDVTLVPWDPDKTGGTRRAAGLFDSDGTYMTEGVCLRRQDFRVSREPARDPQASIDHRPGRYLFGGLFYAHFGHFLCESTSRLWALDHAEGPFDGVLFYPKLRMSFENRMTRPLQPFMSVLGFPDLPLIAPQKPVRVDELVIPEQGFGINLMAAGRPEYRSFMRERLTRNIPAEGPLRLYVSRSGLNSKRGSVLMEDRMESLLADEGYEIFHPQAHPIEAQIARYRAARQIVSLDCSALHLAAMVLDPACRIAIINRGPSQNIDDYILQFRHFAGVAPLRIDALSAYWSPVGAALKPRETHAMLDFVTIGAALAAGGFVASVDGWHNADEAVVMKAVAIREERMGMRLQRHGPDG